MTIWQAMSPKMSSWNVKKITSDSFYSFQTARILHNTAFFKPVKQSRRKTLGEWKKKNRGVIPKPEFPRLLRKDLLNIADKLEDNIKVGFRGCGIIPLDREQGLKRLPPEIVNEEESQKTWTETLTDFLKTQRNLQTPARTKGKKIPVTPGKSMMCQSIISDSETENNSESDDSEISEENINDTE